MQSAKQASMHVNRAKHFAFAAASAASASAELKKDPQSQRRVKCVRKKAIKSALNTPSCLLACLLLVGSTPNSLLSQAELT